MLGAAGHRVSRRREGPAGLTPREVEVLRLLARGMSNKEIAERLVISPKTVANHIEHIYAKIGASTRATASLFAMQHGLLPEERVRGRDGRAQRRLHRLHVPRHRLGDRSQLLGGAELDVLAAGSRQRDVAGREVEGVAGLEDLLAVGEAEGQLGP